MSIAVIIVNYGTAALALEATGSVLARKHGNRSVHVHLIDNASPGNDAKDLATAITTKGWQDRVTLYAEDENHGFGRGCNIVLHRLAEQEKPPEYVLLLNPDAQLDNEAIDLLARDLEANPEAAASGAAILEPNGSPATSAFRFPTPRREIASATHLNLVFRLLRTNPVPLPHNTAAGEVDWVSGAAVLFRFGPLATTGFFDPVFFLYYEEVELMQRLAAQNHMTRYCPQARVIHHEGAATGIRGEETASRKRPAYLYRSWRYYFSKAHGRLATLALSLSVWSAAAFGVAVARLRGRPSRMPVGFFSDHLCHVILPLAGLRRDATYDAALARRSAATG